MNAMPTFDISLWVGQYLWPLSRISAFVMTMPVIGSRIVPVRLRLTLCLMMTLALVPQLHDLPRCEPLGLQCWVLVAEQVLIGIALGFLFQIFFQIANLTGQIVATQTGLGFSSMMDPHSGVSVASVSQFYTMIFTLLFLAMNGHLVLVQYLFQSFEVVPIGGGGFWSLDVDALLRSVSWMFSAALLASLPAVVALLVINLALGVMTRAAPQLNIFSVGFPLTLLLGLLALWISLSGVGAGFQTMLSQAFELSQRILLHRS